MVIAATYCVANEDDLQAKLTEAANNDEDDVIQIVQGTYLGNFIYASTEQNNVTIEGGYLEGCTGRDVNPVNTVLDGQTDGTVLVLSAPDLEAEFSIEGLTIQNGKTLSNGGGIYVLMSGTVTVKNSLLRNNHTEQSGGGCYLSASNTSIVESIFNDNSAFDGGAALIIGDSIAITNNYFDENRVIWHGGGIHAHGNTITFRNNTITNNTTLSEGSGGGIYIYGATSLAMINNVIHKNSSYWHGGGIGADKINEIIFTNNTISENYARQDVGGISIKLFEDDEIAKIYNNIILNNQADNPGNDIFIDNDWNENHSYSEAEIFNNDFDHCESGFFITEPNFTIHSSNLDNVDPSFVPAIDDYHLQEDSPCINAGDDGAPELPLTDKDGNPRKVESAVDIGAYEYQGFIAPISAFMASPLVGVAPLTVNFTDQSTGSIDSWYWDFGDGNDSTLQNPPDTKTIDDYITVVSPDAPDLSCQAKEFHCYEFGQKIVVKLQVENSGNTKANPFDVVFYLSDNGITQDELLALDTVMGGLNSQHTKVQTLRYEAEIPLSGKYIIAVIDPDGRVLELDETNNIFTIRIP
jgi:hypothetical protein